MAKNFGSLPIEMGSIPSLVFDMLSSYLYYLKKNNKKNKNKIKVDKLVNKGSFL